MTIERRVVEGAAAGPTLLITGGVHGDEFEPMKAVRTLIQDFHDEKARDRLRGKLVLAPIVNFPAFLNGRRTAADDGLDLARTCPGDPAGGTTERIAAELTSLIGTADYYIDLHTGGIEMSVYPLAGYSLHPDPDVLAKQRGMARAFNLSLVWGTSPELEGRSLSVARDANVPAIYTEHHGSGFCREEGVRDYVEGCYNVMAYLDMIDQQPSPSRIRYEVEDDRPASGHLQICNPAPRTGFFEPLVALGDKVRVGDPLGHVFDTCGDDRQPVLSQQRGVVIVVRTFSRVREGESVGVILEIPEESR
ncbi:MAG: M14 family metallopeptidase [Pirellulaceae bacterium]|jgi:predicted deacylase|nr:M14 family metallopeptidase [Pirellulaceae bacterium]MDP7019325.1 M14 family metallopeptidase [Pirellulaceae bacterium]